MKPTFRRYTWKKLDDEKYVYIIFTLGNKLFLKHLNIWLHRRVQFCFNKCQVSARNTICGLLPSKGTFCTVLGTNQCTVGSVKSRRLVLSNYFPTWTTVNSAATFTSISTVRFNINFHSYFKLILFEATVPINFSIFMRMIFHTFCSSILFQFQV